MGANLDPRERTKLWQEAFNAALTGLKANLWTSLPGIIQDFDPADLTVTVQLAIQGKQRSQQGVFTDITITPLVKCPVIFPGGGGFLLTFPLAKGDECDVLFACRSVDAWWQNGGVQPQIEVHFHDLSDGFCLPKIYSVPNVPEGVSTTTAQLRSVDGLTYLEIADGEINIQGNLNVSGDIDQLGGGVTGSFTTPTGQIVTVTNGLVTNIF